MIAGLTCLWNLRARSRARVILGPPTLAQYGVLVRLHTCADMMASLNPGKLGSCDFPEMVKLSSMAYDGTEIRPSEPLSTARLLPGLPPPELTATIPLADLCTGAVRDAILDPNEVRLDEPHEVPPGRPRVHVVQGESREKIFLTLLGRRILKPVRFSEVWRYKGEPILNGLFGVAKSGAKVALQDGSGREVSPLRTIMSLVQSNAHQRRILGDVTMLPTAGHWNALTLLAGEVALLSSMDRRCFFYTFAVPQAWTAGMAFVGTLAGSLCGMPEEPAVLLGSACPGMGWCSAVDVTQHAHRNMMQNHLRKILQLL